MNVNLKIGDTVILRQSGRFAKVDGELQYISGDLVVTIQNEDDILKYAAVLEEDRKPYKWKKAAP